MDIINLPMTGCFDSKTIELADKFQKAETGAQFKLCLYDSGTVAIDSVLAFHEIMRTRPKGISVHIHSHICLMGSEVLVWLAGDTRTLRSDAWIHFWEYNRYWQERSNFQQFLDSLERRELQGQKTPFQENYLQVERLVEKQIPTHLLNRRVWAAELDEWNIIKPAIVVAVTATGVSPKEKKATSPEAAKATENATQRTLF
jgi:hypothetical protein